MVRRESSDLNKAQRLLGVFALEDEMGNRRNSDRHVLQQPGRVIIEGLPYACSIFDLSKTGARLTKLGKLKLPSTFLIEHPHASSKPCWLVWQDESQAGISFTEPNT